MRSCMIADCLRSTQPRMRGHVQDEQHHEQHAAERDAEIERALSVAARPAATVAPRRRRSSGSVRPANAGTAPASCAEPVLGARRRRPGSPSATSTAADDVPRRPAPRRAARARCRKRCTRPSKFVNVPSRSTHAAAGSTQCARALVQFAFVPTKISGVDGLERCAHVRLRQRARRRGRARRSTGSLTRRARGGGEDAPRRRRRSPSSSAPRVFGFLSARIRKSSSSPGTRGGTRKPDLPDAARRPARRPQREQVLVRHLRRRDDRRSARAAAAASASGRRRRSPRPTSSSRLRRRACIRAGNVSRLGSSTNP